MTSPSDNNNGSRDDELVGRLLAGRYRINRRIGVGGMGAVYEAFHVDLRRKVAVKVLLDPRKRAIERFEQEAFANAKVHSPHVVNVIDFIVDEGGREPPFIVMELLDGEPLSQRLQREKTIPLATAIEITRQLLVGLEAAHSLGIVHRDIKPSNIWLTTLTSSSGEPLLLVKILDFGVAKLLVDPTVYKTTTGVLVGTPSYLAPEQINGTTIDGRTDLHAVATVLFEMLVGERPWGSRRGPEVVISILSDKPPTLLEKITSSPPALSSLIERALSKNINDRPPSAAAMASELSSIQGASPAKKRAPPSSRSSPSRARTFLIALAATLLVTSVIAIPFITKKRASQPQSQPQSSTLAPPSGAPLPPESSATTTAVAEQQQQQQQDEDASSTTTLATTRTSTTPHVATAKQSQSELPPGTKPYCHCQYHAQGHDYDLCEQPMPFRCTCEAKLSHEPLCAQTFTVVTAANGEKQWQCRTRAFTGQPGARCEGYGKPAVTPEESSRSTVWHAELLIDGTLLECLDCYNPPLRPGVPNTRCVGYKDGRRDGTWKCFEGTRAWPDSRN